MRRASFKSGASISYVVQRLHCTMTPPPPAVPLSAPRLLLITLSAVRRGGWHGGSTAPLRAACMFRQVKHDTCGGYNGEPANECGVGVLGGGNCIRNSTTKMSAALKKYGAVVGKEIVYYIDHGNPTSPQRMFNPRQRFVSVLEEV
jgi:hypothetical protein